MKWLAASANALLSFVPQRRQRIYRRGAARWNQAGGHGDERDASECGDKTCGVIRAETEEHGAQKPHGRERERQADSDASKAEQQAFPAGSSRGLVRVAHPAPCARRFLMCGGLRDRPKFRRVRWRRARPPAIRKTWRGARPRVAARWWNQIALSA